jgi:hypothetical protein
MLRSKDQDFSNHEIKKESYKWKLGISQ